MAKIKAINDNMKTEVPQAFLERLAFLLSLFKNNEEAFSSLSMKNSFSALSAKSGEWKNTPVDDLTRVFIKLEQSFLKQYSENPGFFGDQSKYQLREKMKLSSEILIQCNPDIITLQTTEEGSIFYTVRKKGISIYFQHFLVDDFDDSDEAIVSVFKDEKKLLDFGGSLPDTVTELATALASESIVLPEFA